jgi:hypothetical protein
MNPYNGVLEFLPHVIETEMNEAAYNDTVEEFPPGLSDST